MTYMEIAASHYAVARREKRRDLCRNRRKDADRAYHPAHPEILHLPVALLLFGPWMVVVMNNKRYPGAVVVHTQVGTQKVEIRKAAGADEIVAGLAGNLCGKRILR